MSDFFPILAVRFPNWSFSYEHARYCLHKYFRGAHYTKAFGSIAEATAEATDHLWEIAPLNRAIPEFLKPGKIYFANKLPLNTQGE